MFLKYKGPAAESGVAWRVVFAHPKNQRHVIPA
jgi:hypothetical protein